MPTVFRSGRLKGSARRRRPLIPFSKGVNAYTLTAEAGSYTLSGQAATLVTTRLLVGEAGSYTLTGQAATLQKRMTLVAEAGAYTLTGQAATLLQTSLLTANAGSYAISGQAASLLKTWLVTANAGAYALTGQDATLVYTPAGAYTLTAAAGSYEITGQSVTLTYVAIETEAAAFQEALAIYGRRRRKRQKRRPEELQPVADQLAALVVAKRAPQFTAQPIPKRAIRAEVQREIDDISADLVIADLKARMGELTRMVEARVREIEADDEEEDLLLMLAA